MIWREWARCQSEGWREDRVPLTAAGVTYYLCLANFLALAAFVAVYGLFLDPLRLAILPAIIGFLPLGDIGKALIAFVRWPVLVLMVGLALSALYRWGPDHPAPPWLHWAG